MGRFGGATISRRFGIARRRACDVSNEAVSEPLLHVVLFQPDIPQNTGNIGRTCVAVGAKLWLIRPLGFRLDEKHLRRAGMDYWQHLDWEAVDSWQDVRDRLPGRRWWCLTKFAT